MNCRLRMPRPCSWRADVHESNTLGHRRIPRLCNRCADVHGRKVRPHLHMPRHCICYAELHESNTLGHRHMQCLCNSGAKWRVCNTLGHRRIHCPCSISCACRARTLARASRAACASTTLLPRPLPVRPRRLTPFLPSNKHCMFRRDMRARVLARRCYFLAHARFHVNTRRVST
jgi:hypothetical protein